MKYRQYKFKFYLNASHAISIGGKLRQKHPHTWEITLNTLKLMDGFIQFNQLETRIEEFFDTYQDKVLNEVDPFDVVNPTLENCCEYFKTQLQSILNEEGWVLLMIEMSETPTRTFVINTLEDEAVENQQAVELMANSFLKRVKEQNVANESKEQ